MKLTTSVRLARPLIVPSTCVNASACVMATMASERSFLPSLQRYSACRYSRRWSADHDAFSQPRQFPRICGRGVPDASMIVRPATAFPLIVMNSARPAESPGTTHTIGPMTPFEDVDQQPRNGAHGSAVGATVCCALSGAATATIAPTMIPRAIREDFI